MSNSSKLKLWRELFSQYPQSDLTVAEFCHQHHVRVHQFYYWRDKVEAVSSRESALVPVQIPATRAAADVDLCSLRLRLPNGVEVSGSLSNCTLCCPESLAMNPCAMPPSTELKRVFLYR